MKHCCVKDIEEKYCEELLWRNVVKYCCVKNIEEKYCEELLWRSIVKYCCRELLW